MQGERNNKKQLADFCFAEPQPVLSKVVQGERNNKKQLADFFCFAEPQPVLSKAVQDERRQQINPPYFCRFTLSLPRSQEGITASPAIK